MENPYKQFLESEGYVLTETADYYKTNAIYRGGNNKTALSINKQNGKFTDWAGGGGTFEMLVGLIKGTSDDPKIQEYIRRAGEYQDSFVKINKIKVNKYHPPECLERLLPYWKFYVEERQISSDIMRRHRVGLATTGNLRNFLVSAITDRSGRIVGFFGRYHKNEPPPKVPKTKNIGKKTDWIFPAFLNDGFIRKDKEIILVEGLTDLYSFETIGIYKCICLFGIKISSAVVNYICGIQGVKVIIATNNDLIGKGHGAGNSAALEIQRKLSKLINKEQIEIRLPEKDNDWNAMMVRDKSEFRKVWLTPP